MKKILLLILLIFALAFTFVACEEVHQHSFDTAWSKDSNNHWHQATCEHTDEVNDEAPHNFVAVPGDTRLECDVCGYSRNIQVNPEPQPKPEPPHEHSFAIELSFDETYHWYASTCAHTGETKDKKHHEYVDGICNVCGWWSSATEVLFAELSKLDVWNYTVMLDDVVINNVNLLSEGIEHDSLIVSGELKLSMSADGQIEGLGYLESNGQTVKAVVSNGIVYVCSNDKYIRCNLSDLLAQADLDIEQTKSYIDKVNADTQAIRGYVEQAQQYLDVLPTDNGTVKQLLATLVKADEANSTNGLNAYILDVDVLRQLNNLLASTTVQQYVDAALGEGFFAGLPNYVKGLFGKKVCDIFGEIKSKYGYSLDDVLAMLNSAINIFHPNENVNTIEDLLKDKGYNLNGASVKALIVLNWNSRLETVLNGIRIANSKVPTVNEIVDKVDNICKACGDKTLYEIMLANNTEMTTEDLKLLVDQVADLLDERVTIEFYISSEGVLQQVEIVVDENKVEDNQAVNDLQQLFAEISGSITLKRDFELQQDYSQVIDQVNNYYDSQEKSVA